MNETEYQKMSTDKPLPPPPPKQFIIKKDNVKMDKVKNRLLMAHEPADIPNAGDKYETIGAGKSIPPPPPSNKPNTIKMSTRNMKGVFKSMIPAKPKSYDKYENIGAGKSIPPPPSPFNKPNTLKMNSPNNNKGLLKSMTFNKGNPTLSDKYEAVGTCRPTPPPPPLLISNKLAAKSKKNNGYPSDNQYEIMGPKKTNVPPPPLKNNTIKAFAPSNDNKYETVMMGNPKPPPAPSPGVKKKGRINAVSNYCSQILVPRKRRELRIKNEERKRARSHERHDNSSNNEESVDRRPNSFDTWQLSIVILLFILLIIPGIILIMTGNGAINLTSLHKQMSVPKEDYRFLKNGL